MIRGPALDNTEAEIEAFSTVCDRLGGFDARLSAEWVDGYLCALVAGPRPVPLAEWLPRMAGDAYDRAFADPEDRRQAEQALQRRQAMLGRQLDPGALDAEPQRDRLIPLMLQWDEDPARTGADWAEGFSTAVRRDFVSDWVPPPEAADDVRYLEEDLFAIEQLREPGPEDRDAAIDAACFAVQDLRLWWLDHAPRTAPRRVEKAPGRNDPCPCGSGRKFKKCHGAAAG